MRYDPWWLYQQMLLSRRFEEAVSVLWNEGAISGEMHLGVGEEGVVAGLLAHLIDGDAMALDHRGTPPLVMRGVDLTSLLKELLGRVDGLCRGQGGHMHLFSPQHLAASSGIVGASGPTAAGFALAAQHLRPQRLALAFFGDGAMNQGMLMESFNLAAAWKLPVLFVCKDDGWAITTRSPDVTGGDLLTRARGLGVPGEAVDGAEVEEVWQAAQRACAHARSGEGPYFLLARCAHFEGHFLGDPLLRVARHPVKEMGPMLKPLLGALLGRRGASMAERVASLMHVNETVSDAKRDRSAVSMDPIWRLRRDLESETERLQQIEEEIEARIRKVVLAATTGPGADASTTAAPQAGDA